MPDPARWENGEPANLAAAAEDSLAWLEVAIQRDLCSLLGRSASERMEERERLAACARALRRYLEAEAGNPSLPPPATRLPRPRLPRAECPVCGLWLACGQIRCTHGSPEPGEGDYVRNREGE